MPATPPAAPARTCSPSDPACPVYDDLCQGCDHARGTSAGNPKPPKFGYPSGCQSPRQRLHFREGFNAGYADGQRGRKFMFSGMFWQVEGYEAGNAAARPGQPPLPTEPFEARKEGGPAATGPITRPPAHASAVPGTADLPIGPSVAGVVPTSPVAAAGALPSLTPPIIVNSAIGPFAHRVRRDPDGRVIVRMPISLEPIVHHDDGRWSVAIIARDAPGYTILAVTRPCATFEEAHGLILSNLSVEA